MPSAPAPADSAIDALQGRSPGQYLGRTQPRKNCPDGEASAEAHGRTEECAKITADRNRAARVLLAENITNLVATRKQQIEELATQYNVTYQHIQKLVDNTSHYRKPRATRPKPVERPCTHEG
jgi:hypothetical protein